MKKNSRHTVETIEKMRLSQNNRYKNNHSPLKGRTLSQELKDRISIRTKEAMANLSQDKRALLSPKGIRKSPSTEFKKGLKFTDEKRLEWSRRAKELGLGKWMNGRTPQFLLDGTHNHPSGEKSSRWKGGITPENTRIRTSQEYNTWRKKVFDRDWYTCTKCKYKTRDIVAHHIKSFSKYPELRFDIDNGITLCTCCHIKLHKEEIIRKY